ncbi:MAG: helix-turn-helix domain-containing protein [Verrucomicrobiota bacterium]|nr:helix-turn-helix domain-containing protein [Verrucomicrobiota bacterium]
MSTYTCPKCGNVESIRPAAKLFYTMNEVADLFEVCRMTIHREIKRGNIKAIKVRQSCPHPGAVPQEVSGGDVRRQRKTPPTEADGVPYYDGEKGMRFQQAGSIPSRRFV